MRREVRIIEALKHEEATAFAPRRSVAVWSDGRLARAASARRERPSALKLAKIPNLWIGRETPSQSLVDAKLKHLNALNEPTLPAAHAAPSSSADR